MGKDLADSYPAARAVFDEADEDLGFSLSSLCFEGPESELMSTQNAQPALLAHGAAAWAVVREKIAPHVSAAAGHSLGEFTAYHAAGTFSLRDALRIVRRRGELMYQSGVERPGAMAAILGLDERHVEEACREASNSTGVVVPANYNSPAQLVISGEVAAVEQAMALSREAGARRAIRLKVSGAFHSPLMDVARDGLSHALEKTAAANPAFPVYSNVTAEAVRDAATACDLLISQLTSPVCWTALVRDMVRDFPEPLFLELGPGSVLANLVHRIVPGAQVVGCGTVEEVEHVLQRFG
jgi:[acyl-carrier-protein] S-malonyltransferase